MPPKKNPLKLNNLQLRTLALAQLLATRVETRQQRCALERPPAEGLDGEAFAVEAEVNYRLGKRGAVPPGGYRSDHLQA